MRGCKKNPRTAISTRHLRRLANGVTGNPHQQRLPAEHRSQRAWLGVQVVPSSNLGGLQLERSHFLGRPRRPQGLPVRRPTIIANALIPGGVCGAVSTGPGEVEALNATPGDPEETKPLCRGPHRNRDGPPSAGLQERGYHRSFRGHDDSNRSQDLPSVRQLDLRRFEGGALRSTAPRVPEASETLRAAQGER